MSMTVKEKEEHLVSQFLELFENSDLDIRMHLRYAKRCALVAVENALYALSLPPINNEGHMLYDSQIEYWNMVKEQIKKL